MKTLKFLLTLFVAITMFTLSSYSQGNVKTSEYDGPYELVGAQLPGVPETVTGSFGGWWTVWYAKAQWRANGTYVGDISGTIYYTSNVANYMYKSWMPGAVYTNVQTIRIVDEYGVVYYEYHYNDHFTFSSEGDFKADVLHEYEFFF